MIFSLIFIFGFIFNRIRGGLLTDLVNSTPKLRKKVVSTCFYDREKKEVRYAKVLHDLVFTLIFSIVLKATFFGSVFIYLGMLAGRSMGWGAYIGGLIDDTIKDGGEIKFIDKLFLTNKDHPDIRNTAALGIRGMMWTACIAFGIAIGCSDVISLKQIGLIIISGLPMGVIYNAVFEIDERYKIALPLVGAWGIAEMFFGGYLWSTLYLILN